MNLIIICIHDREQNLKHWLHCWKQCKQFDQLVIIHSDNGRTYEVPEGVIYIKRPNIGYDIGKFQDICRNRMPGIPEWEKLLWISDDCMPMIKDFATPFFVALNRPGVAVACMEISPFVREHIRTTGFAITREVAEQLQFPADPIITKEHCYQFEHRSVTNHFLAQIKAMGLKAVMVAPKESSPLFDFGYGRRIRGREVIHYNTFGREEIRLQNYSRQQVINEIDNTKPIDNPTITVICPIFDKYPQIISSLLCQTYKNWQLELVHDGPDALDLPDDPRINYTRIERKTNDYGHTIRRDWLQKSTSNFTLITNPDNYYAPVFLERALAAFVKYPYAVAVYCNEMVHSYKDWQIIPCQLRLGFIDCGGVLLRTAEAKAVGWNSFEHSADWTFFKEIADHYGANKFVPFRGAMFVHN